MKIRTKFLVKLWVQEPSTPSPTKKYSIFRDILLAINILGILTRGIVKTIFFEYFKSKKNGGRGGIHPRPH